MIARVAIGLLCCAAAFAQADEAPVVWSDPSCRNFILHIGDEFAIYEWRQGNAPDEGDTISGKLLETGMLEVENKTKGGGNSAILVAMHARLNVLVNSSPVICKKRWRSS